MPIGLGLRRREPSIAFRAASGVIPDGALDPQVLQMAADAGRILVSRDVSTMHERFSRFAMEYDAPGVLPIRSVSLPQVEPWPGTSNISLRTRQECSRQTAPGFIQACGPNPQ
jgi:hypothetical protein